MATKRHVALTLIDTATSADWSIAQILATEFDAGNNLGAMTD